MIPWRAFWIFYLLATIGLWLSTSAHAQTQTSPNLITNPNFNTTSGWSVTGMAGGQQWHPSLPPNGTGYSFSYMQGTIAQTFAINQALSGVGIQVQGFDYGFQYQIYCANSIGGNCTNPTGTADSLSYIATITNSAGQSIYTDAQNLSGGYMPSPTGINVQQRFASPYALSNLGNFSISFTGQDGGFWGGNYGPTISNVYSRAVYTVDPCVGNPRYNPSCAGYANADMWSTGDLTSIYGTAFAINQALGFGNSGVRVHSATWGYDYTIGGRWCSTSFLGICLQWSESYVDGTMVVQNSNGGTVASDSQRTQGENISGQFRREVLLGTTSPDISTLGNASVGISTTGIASATPYLGFNFTPDVCQSNPLASPQCPDYAAAYFTQQCTSNPLSDPTCPGYAQAYFTQQCSANPLYDAACPGYAAAYLTYQCSANPLYAPQCPGYTQAYLEQQCSSNPLYSTECSGYQTATQQCSANPLIASYCPNYESASLSCSINPLTANYCPDYTSATASCSANPLVSSYCPGYANTTAQCSTNALTYSYCPGYQTALTACSTNPMSNTLCSGYTAASSACSANSLTYTYCPSYNTVLAACATNPQSNTMCPGYTATNTASSSSPATSTVSITEPTVQVSSDGKVTTDIAIVSDSAVNSVITTTTTSVAPSATATVPLAPVASPTSGGLSNAVSQTSSASSESTTKTESKTTSSSTERQSSQQSAKSDSKSDVKVDSRQSAEMKQAAAKKAQDEIKRAEMTATFESQVAVQQVVIGAMNFVPGFEAYGTARIVDINARELEKKYGSPNVDNRSILRQLSGASDKLHQEMMEQQWR